MRKFLLAIAAYFFAAVAFAQVGQIPRTLTGGGGAPLTPFSAPIIGATDGVTGPSNSVAQYMAPSGSAAPWSAAIANREVPWKVSGTARDLTCRFPTALTQGSYAITIMVNNVASTLLCTINTSQGSDRDTTHTVSINANDAVAIRSTPSGTPTTQSGAIQISFVFTSNGQDNVIVIPFTSDPSTSAKSYTPIGQWNGLTQWQSTQGSDAANETFAAGLCPSSNTFNGIAVELQTAPGASKSWTLSPYLNGVNQVTAGNADPCTISGSSALTCQARWNFSCVANDKVSLEASPSGTPANPTLRASVAYTPTVSGEAVQINSTSVATGGANRFFPYNGEMAPQSTETTAQSLAPCAFTAKKLYVAVTPNVSGGTRTHVMRMGATSGSQTSQSLQLAMAIGSAGGNDTSDTVSVPATSFINWASLTSLAAATTSYKYSSVMSGCVP